MGRCLDADFDGRVTNYSEFVQEETRFQRIATSLSVDNRGEPMFKIYSMSHEIRIKAEACCI